MTGIIHFSVSQKLEALFNKKSIVSSKEMLKFLRKVAFNALQSKNIINCEPDDTVLAVFVKGKTKYISIKENKDLTDALELYFIEKKARKRFLIGVLKSIDLERLKKHADVKST